MRYVNGFFCVLMVLFAIVQYNDPDVALWVLIYAIPAAWAGLAALRPGVLQGRPATLGLAASIVVAIIGTAYMWPAEAGWWRREVWWESELAREGMGLMVVTLALFVVAGTRWLRGRTRGRAA